MKELLKEGESQEGGRPPGPKARRGGLLGVIQLLGPGLITGASDDDPSGIGTYSQVGSHFGYGMLWTAFFTFPLLVGMCIAALLIANTINLGADLGAIATGGSILSRGTVPALWLVLPVAALILYLQFFVSYRRIFNTFK